jgi:hypothetical protein
MYGTLDGNGESMRERGTKHKEQRRISRIVKD